MSHLLDTPLQQRGSTAMREAVKATAEQRYRSAAVWCEVAADAYHDFAKTVDNPDSAAEWQRVADQAETAGYDAWAVADNQRGHEQLDARLHGVEVFTTAALVGGSEEVFGVRA